MGPTIGCANNHTKGKIPIDIHPAARSAGPASALRNDPPLTFQLLEGKPMSKMQTVCNAEGGPEARREDHCRIEIKEIGLQGAGPTQQYALDIWHALDAGMRRVGR